jgi:hypothetical protein
VRDWSGLPAPEPTERAWLSLGGELVPVWVVEQRELSPARHWRYLVEANTGAVLWRFDQLLHNDGYVYQPNPVVSDGEVTQVELPDLESDQVLEGTLARAFQCVGAPAGDCTTWDGPCRECGLREHYALADDEGNFLYMPDEPNLRDPFAEVNAYYHVSQINQWYEDTFGFEVRCRGSRAVDIHVNYSIPGDPQTSANAFFGDTDGDGCGDITMGEGMGVDLAYDGDVIYHEFSHGVVASTGGLGCGYMGVCIDELGLDWTALGLNEGFADYFAVTFSGDPIVGEHAGLAFGDEEGIRTGTNQNICPFDLAGESHYDGQIWLGVGWDLREALGPEVTDWLMFHALLAISNDAGYAEAAAALQEAADQAMELDLLDDQGRAELERIIGPEGRRIADCSRIVPLDHIPEGHAEEPLFLYSYMGSSLPAGLQWSITAPRRAQELRFWVEEGEQPAGWVRVHVRLDEPVGIEVTSNGWGVQTTYTSDFDVRLDDDVLVLTPESEPPLEEGRVYHFALEFMCQRGCNLLPHGEVTAIPNDLPLADAGPDLRVEVGELVELDASASYDPQGDQLSFTWTQMSGPTAELDGQGSSASFVASSPGMHSIVVTVTDEEGGTGEDIVDVFAYEPDPERGGLNASGGGLDCGCRAVGPSAPYHALSRLLEVF